MGKCHECMHWHRMDDKAGYTGDWGQCRYQAPVGHWSPTYKDFSDYAFPPFRASWPITGALDTCGQFEYEEDDNGDP